MQEQQFHHFHVQQKASVALANRHQARVPLYARFACYPGDDFLFVGESYPFNYEPEKYMERAKTIALLLRPAPPDHRRWRHIGEMIGMEDFTSILMRFEKELLVRLQDGVIGPAFDPCGSEIAGAFAVWRKTNLNRCSGERELAAC